MKYSLLKKIVLFTIVAFVLLISCLFIANRIISNGSGNKIYTNVNYIPFKKVGLLLGTSKYVIGGRQNLYYTYRIEAAVSLFLNKKIAYVLVSGDNSTTSYNEPKKIKEDLIKRGIPENRIVLDYAGFRTLDSVVRANKVFDLSEFTIISQQFHNERALYLATHFGSNAIAFNAKNVGKRYGLKVQIREYFARVKVFIDLIFKVQPKFLGKKIVIG